MASLEKIEDSNLVLVKYLDNWFKLFYDHIGDMADVVGTSNVNAHRGKGQRAMKSLFRNRKRMMDSKNKEDEGVKFIPGVGKIRITPNEDWE